MIHADLALLTEHESSPRTRRREILHLDGCLTCRRRAVESGIAEADIAVMIAQARSRSRALVATVLIAGLVGAVAVATPLRGAALGFISIFEPRTVAAVPLTLDDMRGLSRMPDLSAYATTREFGTPKLANFSDARSAAAAAGFEVREPAYVPDGIAAASYAVHGGNSQLLTFVNRAPIASNERPRVLLPRDIVGSTLRIDLGTTVLAAYMTGSTAAEERRLRLSMQRLAAPPSQRPLRVEAATGYAWTGHLTQGRRSGTDYGWSGHVTEVRCLRTNCGFTGHITAFRRSGDSVGSPAMRPASPAHFGAMGLMPLVVVQMPVPRVSSTGVSVARLASFMLSQPGIPPHVAAAFGALGDLSTTLPLPIPVDKAYAQPVFVDGVRGLGIGDDTGIGAAVVWQKNGMLYGVFATRTAHDVLAIANSLR